MSPSKFIRFYHTHRDETHWQLFTLQRRQDQQDDRCLLCDCESPHGGGLRTGASCSWHLEKICNWFAVKGPFETLSLAVMQSGTSKFLKALKETKDLAADKTCFFFSILGTKVISPSSISSKCSSCALAFNSDGRYLATRGVDRHVHISDVTGTLFLPYVSDTELQSSTLVHLIEVSRRALTVGRDRVMQLHKEGKKAEKLDGGGGKRGKHQHLACLHISIAYEITMKISEIQLLTNPASLLGH
ncbi:WD40/YVTN repeat-like-containing domain protein [Raphanus sativus]|nr:WD40/YVTN repeat-like-containing domain protein [Raphanus sativus]